MGARLKVGRDDDRREWEELATLDPLWAIATRPGKRFDRWDTDAFFAGGQRRIARLMAAAECLGHPRGRARALDFGCGVGRHARPLSEYFDQCVGVDVSEQMVEHARRLNRGVTNLRFMVNAEPDLRAFGDGQFDLVHSRLVLQHISPTEVSGSYIPELVRVLRSGGLLWFQLPSALPRRYRLGSQRRAYRALRRLGIPSGFLYRRLRLQPMRMTAIPEPEVRALLSAAGARLLDMPSRRTSSGVRSSTYLATRD